MTEETIDNYFDCDKVRLTAEGLPEHILTKNGRIWSCKPYQKKPGWLKPQGNTNGAINISYNGGQVVLNINALVAKYFIVPAMLATGNCKYIPGTNVLVHRSGVVFDADRGKFKKMSPGGRYLHFRVGDKYYNLHRIVAQLFVPNPDPEHYDTVGHKDHNRWNNDASNLYWCTQAQNLADSRADGRMINDGSVSKADKAKGWYAKRPKADATRWPITMMQHVEGPNFP